MINKIIHGNCIEEMKKMEENSVHSIVTDPPYGLKFMGKKWDYKVPSVATWVECLRVLKPGGYLLSFAGTRTQHRMAVNIEDAGFEIRDMIAWVYGSGFPKSHNIANSIDKKNGFSNRGHAISSGSKIHPSTGKPRASGELLPAYKARSEDGKKWEGWGTALKPAMEPITVARKPLSEKTVAANVLKYGTGGINIDGCRIDVDNNDTNHRIPSVPFNKKANIYQGKRGGREIENLNNKGRFPANFIHDGSDEVEAIFPETKSGEIKDGAFQGKNKDVYGDYSGWYGNGYNSSEGSASRFFYTSKASKSDRNEGMYDFEEKQYSHDGREKEIENPYQRNKSISKNNHPTVKPTDLMQYLIRLVTPEDGIVLDPFMGSGSTGKACIIEGFSFIGMDDIKGYCDIAQKRIDGAKDGNLLYWLDNNNE